MGAATAAAITVGASALSGYASARANEKATKESRAAQNALSKRESLQNMEESKYDADLSYYYEQLARQNKQRGLDNYRRYSTIGKENTSSIVVPTKPDSADYEV